MATTLIAKETSHTSTSTYYKLNLDSLTRSGSILTITLHVYIKLGSETAAGSNWNRTWYVYNSSGTQIASKVIKEGTTKWVENGSYDYTLTFTYNVGTNAAWSASGFYIRILGGSGTSCIWDGKKSTTGGTVGQTFSLSASASNIVYFWNGSTWKEATPYVWNGSAWKEATVYVWNGSAWKECY